MQGNIRIQVGFNDYLPECHLQFSLPLHTILDLSVFLYPIAQSLHKT